MSTTLNEDCWRLIGKCLDGEFLTFSRILQASKQLHSIFAPKLYGQLGMPAYQREIDSWSIRKRNNLATLLFLSSGYIDATTKPRQVNNKNFIRIPYNGSLVQSVLVSHIRHPLTTNYYNLLTILPENLVQQFWLTSFQPGQETDVYYNRQRYYEHHAEKLTYLQIDTVEDSRIILPLVDRFCQLSDIYISDIHGTDISEVQENLTIFIITHKTSHPQETLMEISCYNESLQVKLMKVLKPTTVTITSQEHLFESSLEMFENVQKLGILCGIRQNLISDSQRLAKLFQACPMLEDLRVNTSKEISYDLWREAFAWVPSRTVVGEEINEFARSGTTGRLSLPPQQQQEDEEEEEVEEGRQPKPPPKLKVFSSRGKSIDLYDVVFDRFCDTLEYVSILVRNPPKQIGSRWTCPMNRLTRLKLSNCCFQFEKLELCRHLEDLRLQCVNMPPGLRVPRTMLKKQVSESSGSGVGYGGIWKAPLGMKILHLIDGEAFQLLDLESLASAWLIENLNLKFHSPDLDPKMQQDDGDALCKMNWRFDYLKTLSVDDVGYKIWQRMTTKLGPLAAPNIQTLVIDQQHPRYTYQNRSFRPLSQQSWANDERDVDEGWVYRPRNMTDELNFLFGHSIRVLDFQVRWSVTGWLEEFIEKLVATTTTEQQQRDQVTNTFMPNLLRLKLPHTHISSGFLKDRVVGLMDRCPMMELLHIGNQGVKHDLFVHDDLVEIPKQDVVPFGDMDVFGTLLTGTTTLDRTLNRPLFCTLVVSAAGSTSPKYFRLVDS